MAKGENGKWELKSADDVAKALEWLRSRANGNTLVLLAINKNTVSYCKDKDLSPRDAQAMIEAALITVREGFYKLDANMWTRSWSRREDVENGGR